MKRKVYYGSIPKFTDNDRDIFSRNGYKCKKLMQDLNGRPVAISQSTDTDFPIWKVEYGFSTVVFRTYEDAMSFCRSRFSRG